MGTPVESRCALYAAYTRILEYGRNNLLTTYVKDVSFAGGSLEFSGMDKKQDAAIYLLLYYGIHSEYGKALSSLVPEIKSMLTGRIDFDCSSIEAEDVVSLFDSEVSHIPFEGYDERTSKMDYKNLQEELRSILGTSNIYEPFASLTSFCLPYSCKYSSDRNEYLILTVYSLLAREALKNAIMYDVDWSFGEPSFFGDEGAEFLTPGTKFHGMVLYGLKTAETMEMKIREGLDLLDDNGVMAVLDFDFVINDSIFWNMSSEDRSLNLRKYLIDNNLLDAIYSGYIEVGDDDASMYVLKKGRKDDKVHIIDAVYSLNKYANEHTVDVVTTSIIREYGYSFSSKELRGIPKLSKDELSYSMSVLLDDYYPGSHNNAEGRVFVLEDFGRVKNRDLSSFIVTPEILDIHPVDASYKKAAEPVIVISPYIGKLEMAYVKASKEYPVYFPDYCFVRKVKEEAVLPEYIYYLLQNGTMQRVFDSCEGYSWESAGSEWGLFYGMVEKVPVPISLEEQKKRIADAELIWKVETDKETARERLFNQKEWLNERHIRTIKHRLRDELTPLADGLDRLQSAMARHSGQLNVSDIIGLRSGQTVGELVSSLVYVSGQMSKSLDDLTSIEDFDKPELYDIVSLTENYIGKHHVGSGKYKIEFIDNTGCRHPEIRISERNFTEMIDYVISNAERHGFHGEPGKDYVVRISVSVTNEGNCVILIENNGSPMFPRAEEIYFEHGKYAGDTGHSGIGGARVREIAEHFNGRASLCNDINSDFPVKVMIMFPIINIK